MHFFIDINTFIAWAPWATVLVTLLVVFLQNRNAKRLSCLQLFIQLAAQYDSVQMQRVRASLAAKLLSDPKTLEINDSLLVFYENIAILHRKGLLDSDLMYNTFFIYICGYWQALRHYIEQMRKTFDDDLFLIEFEQLNNYFVQATQTRRGTSSSQVVLTDENVKNFLRWEVLRSREHSLPEQDAESDI
jgi:hypothetical protein